MVSQVWRGVCLSVCVRQASGEVVESGRTGELRSGWASKAAASWQSRCSSGNESMDFTVCSTNKLIALGWGHQFLPSWRPTGTWHGLPVSTAPSPGPRQGSRQEGPARWAHTWGQLEKEGEPGEGREHGFTGTRAGTESCCVCYQFPAPSSRGQGEPGQCSVLYCVLTSLCDLMHGHPPAEPQRCSPG